MSAGGSSEASLRADRAARCWPERTLRNLGCLRESLLAHLPPIQTSRSGTDREDWPHEVPQAPCGAEFLLRRWPGWTTRNYAASRKRELGTLPEEGPTYALPAPNVGMTVDAGNAVRWHRLPSPNLVRLDSGGNSAPVFSNLLVTPWTSAPPPPEVLESSAHAPASSSAPPQRECRPSTSVSSTASPAPRRRRSSPLARGLSLARALV